MTYCDLVFYYTMYHCALSWNVSLSSCITVGYTYRRNRFHETSCMYNKNDEGIEKMIEKFYSGYNFFNRITKTIRKSIFFNLFPLKYNFQPVDWFDSVLRIPDFLYTPDYISRLLQIILKKFVHITIKYFTYDRIFNGIK